MMLLPTVALAQQDIVDKINYYGTLDHWTVREIRESGIIGGATKHLYEFYGSQTDTIRYDSKKSKAFRAPAGYYWRTNNVYANVAGIEKVNVTVFPEKRGNGYCIRIETHLEELKVAGMLNMDVVCQGVFLLGGLVEPIKDTKAPMAKTRYGIPFEGRPKALRFDYKAKVGCEVVKATGFCKPKKMGYKDYPEFGLLLQKRWEDEDGRIHALRVGTAMERITEDRNEWQNAYTMSVHYGDITEKPFYKDYMGLLNGTEQDLYAVNSKGKTVRVIEEGWAEADEEPNYLIIRFLSSCEKAFHGGLGNTLWIDNIKLVM